MGFNLQQRPSEILKIVLFGPESTGKTTLAKALAEAFNTVWVSEYMRDYLQKKWDEKSETCDWDDLLPIAEGQMNYENTATLKARKVLFCDTNLLELYTYSKEYYEGNCPEPIKKSILDHKYDFYFLTCTDIPWVADDLRDKPTECEKMFDLFEKELKDRNLPYARISGNMEQRLSKAQRIVEELIQNKSKRKL